MNPWPPFPYTLIKPTKKQEKREKRAKFPPPNIEVGMKNKAMSKANRSPK
jgi:hypothetical protein